MPVVLSLEGNEPQRRVTVAFRIILIVPHVLFSFVLQMVAFVVIFLAWFAVLFTARMPPGMGDFLRRVLQYQTRVYGYGFLLTDRFPPFDVGPSDYPVELELEEPDRFNRAAVLFRFWLQLFSLFVSQVAVTGLTVILFFVWLVTLISGRVPSTAYVAIASILRYQMRTWAYVGMLTTTHPWGLLGDRDDAVVEGGDLPPTPRVDRLVLGGGAKALIVLCLLLGTGVQAINAATVNWDFSFGRTAELVDMGDDFEDTYERWDDETRDCTRADASTDCQVPVNAALRAAVERYERRLLLLEVPERALDESVEVVGLLDGIHALLGEMSESGDPQEQLRLYFTIEDAKLDYDDAFDDLFTAVSFG